jgi:hypothetical protein
MSTNYEAHWSASFSCYFIPLRSKYSTQNPVLEHPQAMLKPKLSHYTPWWRLGGEEVQLLLILYLGTRWRWMVSITPLPRFSPGERTPGTHCTGGSVSHRAGLDTEARGKTLSPLPWFEPRSPGRPIRLCLYLPLMWETKFHAHAQ